MTNLDRFMAKVLKTDSCWNWTGAKKTSGYGNFYMNKKFVCAHRASYVLFVGEIKEGNVICHKCDNPSCVNPEHLFSGTQKENIRDMKIKGRAMGAIKGGVFHPVSKLTNEDIVKIRARRKAGELLRIIAADFGITEGNVSYIASYKTWANVDDVENKVSA